MSIIVSLFCMGVILAVINWLITENKYCKNMTVEQAKEEFQDSTTSLKRYIAAIRVVKKGKIND